VDRKQAKKSKTRLDRLIGQNIRRERELRKMSRDELAEAIDLTVSHMGLIERGERGATSVTLEKLSHIFHVPISSFFAESGGAPILAEDENPNPVNRQIIGLMSRMTEKETEFLLSVAAGILNLRVSGSLYEEAYRPIKEITKKFDEEISP